MSKRPARLLLLSATMAALSPAAQAAQLLAVGTMPNTIDLSGLTGTLENGVGNNVFGGVGSALAWAGGNTFYALPDRGPNAAPYAGGAAVDNSTSYISRFQTITMSLTPRSGTTGLPFNLTPTLSNTTLLWSDTALTYGTTAGLPSGTPGANTPGKYYFTGRSDGFSGSGSGTPTNARLDPEGARVSPNGAYLYVSDEYGPYVYKFDAKTGQRLQSYTLPGSLLVNTQSPVGTTESSSNSSGRVANKGMEGLAITPDGKTLVGVMQAPLIQDAAQSATSKMLRIVTINVDTGATHEYGYMLTDGSGVSEIIALNDHEFLLDERDGKGRLGGNNTNAAGSSDSNNAAVKKLYKINIAGAQELLSTDTPAQLAAKAIAKSAFMDVVNILNAAGIDKKNIPSKIEGIAFGDDVVVDGTTMHTLWIANDNDFINTTNDTIPQANLSQFYMVGFTSDDLGGSTFAPELVPEPTTLALFGFGIAGLAMLRRRDDRA